MMQPLHHFHFLLKFELDILHHVRRHMVCHDLLDCHPHSQVHGAVHFSKSAATHHLSNDHSTHVERTCRGGSGVVMMLVDNSRGGWEGGETGSTRSTRRCGISWCNRRCRLDATSGTQGQHNTRKFYGSKTSDWGSENLTTSVLIILHR